MNLSTHQLTSGEKSILEKGFNFALGPRKVPNIEVIAAIEPTLRDEEDQVRAERARAAIAGILRNAKPPRPNITREERQALTDLRKNDDIKIVQADKGNVTVVMNASDYEKKAEDILGAAPFVVLPSDPTVRNERKVNATLKNLLQANEITKATHDHIRVSENGTHPPLI